MAWTVLGLKEGSKGRPYGGGRCERDGEETEDEGWGGAGVGDGGRGRFL